MVEEAYCSYEVSKLLKEKGFDETCYACYEYFSSAITMYSGWPFEYKGEVVYNSNNRIKCSTHQMAIRWLREVHGLHIEILAAYHFRCFDGYSFEVYNINEGEFINYASDKGCFKTNEEAVEAALKYCLENLV